MGITEEAGKVTVTAVEAMKSVPLAVALLVVNLAFLGMTGWILSSVAVNANERNRTQTELITSLIKEMRNCQGTSSPRSENRLWFPPSKPAAFKTGE